MNHLPLRIVLPLLACTALAADPPKRVLLVTHAGGFMHDTALIAEKILKESGPKHGFQVTCYRFTADPDARIKIKRKQGDQQVVIETTALEDYSRRYRRAMGEPVTREECGRVNGETLKNFDAVVFFTTSTWDESTGSHPLTKDELRDLMIWVRNGGAFVAVHCGSDTLHNTPYGDLVGATFGGHPWVQKVRLRVEDPKHPAADGFTDGAEIFDEIYQFGKVPADPSAVPLKIQPYTRDRLHIILSVDNSSIDVTKGSREDQDYPVSWCQRVGKGRSFYTSLGHHKEVWMDPRFQAHLVGGLNWALGQAEGDATASSGRARQ
jgi:type 1 glutamine amidotransferase